MRESVHDMLPYQGLRRGYNAGEYTVRYGLEEQHHVPRWDEHLAHLWSGEARGSIWGACFGPSWWWGHDGVLV